MIWDIKAKHTRSPSGIAQCEETHLVPYIPFMIECSILHQLLHQISRPNPCTPCYNVVFETRLNCSGEQLTRCVSLRVVVKLFVTAEAPVGRTVPSAPEPIWYLETARQVMTKLFGIQVNARGCKASCERQAQVIHRSGLTYMKQVLGMSCICQ
jgi:hypothetical protein